MFTIAVLLLIAAIPVAIILNGYVFSVLWLWFIVPFGIPLISIAWACGIISVANFVFRPYNNVDNKTAMEVLAIGVMRSLVYPIVALATGWVITLFM